MKFRAVFIHSVTYLLFISQSFNLILTSYVEICNFNIFLFCLSWQELSQNQCILC